MIATSATGSVAVRSTSNRDSAKGFSLIELLVVLTIMVLLAGLFPLALEHMIPARKLATVSEQLASTLRELQSRALATGRSTSLTPGTSSYTTRDGNGAERVVDLPADMSLRLKEDSSGRTLTDLTFYPDGSSSGGRFEIQYETRHREILVTHLMGRVRDDG